MRELSPCRVAPDNTIKDIKSLIYANQGVSLEQQSLNYAGKVLKDDRYLRDTVLGRNEQ
jgi:hypothetical protein